MSLLNFPDRRDHERETERRHSLWEADRYALDRAIEELDEIARAEHHARRRARIHHVLDVVRRGSTGRRRLHTSNPKPSA